MALTDLIYHLCVCIGGGMYLTLPLVNPNEVSRRYFFVHGIPALGVCLAAFLFLDHSQIASRLPWIFLFSASLFCFTVGRNPFFSMLAYGASLIALGGISLELGKSFHFALNLWGSLIMTGLALSAMWLGHWYLTEPKMAIDELTRVAACLIGVTVMRFLWGSYVVGLLLNGKSEMQILNYLMGSSAGLFVMMRYLWGLLLPLALSYFIWGTVRIRSTQSATGILYVMVLAVLTGEILSQYLALFHGIYF